MNNKVFSENSEEYLKKEISICIDDLSKKIIFDAQDKIVFFNSLIEFIITLKPPLEYKELGHPANTINRDFLNNNLEEFIEKYSLKEHSKVYFIFDTIRHAFINYCQGGIYQMYKQREAEGWYPKIIINKNIGYRNDINNLDTQEVKIYRGTSKAEYNSKEYGQSWTLNKNIAEEFAFIHYKDQEAHKGTLRVVIWAKINKNDIYYYDKNDAEEEVIVNTCKIITDSINLDVERLLVEA